MTYKFHVVETATVRCKRTFWNVQLMEKARLAKTAFRPVPWAYNRHAQTIVCFAISALEFLWNKPIKYMRESIEGFDGLPQPIDWAQLDDDQKSHERRFAQDSPVVLLIHGLGDDNQHPYIKRMANMCHDNGWRCAVHDYWRFEYNETRDLMGVINHIHRENPQAPIIAVAYSAGGHILLRYLQEVGKATPLVAAITVSACLDFEQAVKDVKENENITYKLFLAAQTKVCVRRHLSVDKSIDATAVRKWITSESDPLVVYDRFLWSLPNYTYRDHETHTRLGQRYKYRSATSEHFSRPAATMMDKIQVTTLVLHAEDDPIVSGEHVDWDSMLQNKNIIQVHTRRGGHVAWYQGLVPFGATWSDVVCVNFISAILEIHSQTNFLLEVFRTSLLEDPDIQHTSMQPDTLARIVSASDLSAAARVRRR